MATRIYRLPSYTKSYFLIYAQKGWATPMRGLGAIKAKVDKKEIEKAIKDIRDAPSVKYLEAFKDATHPKIQKALVERLATESSKPKPDREMLSWLIKNTDPAAATEHLRKILTDPSAVLTPEVVKALVFAGATNKALAVSFTDLLELFKTIVQDSIPDLKQGVLHAAILSSIFAAIGISDDPDGLSSWRLYQRAVLTTALTLELGVMVGPAEWYWHGGIDKVKNRYLDLQGSRTLQIILDEKNPALSIVDQCKILFLMEELPRLLHSPIYDLHDEELLECLKYIDRDPDDKDLTQVVRQRFAERVQFLVGSTLDPDNYKALEDLVSQVLELNSVHWTERLAAHVRSSRIADKLAELANSSFRKQRKDLLVQAGSMYYLLGDQKNGYQALSTCAQECALLKEQTREDTLNMMAALALIGNHDEKRILEDRQAREDYLNHMIELRYKMAVMDNQSPEEKEKRDLLEVGWLREKEQPKGEWPKKRETIASLKADLAGKKDQLDDQLPKKKETIASLKAGWPKNRAGVEKNYGELFAEALERYVNDDVD